ncbi:MAG: 2,3-bisphosphoglycerate-independent phosphoglycerate mutase [Acidobacteriaceae bacterium]
MTPVVLVILAGWGFRAVRSANAVALARKPTYDKLLAEFPNGLLHASDHYVGLPDGQMGNSEVGHLNIGSGRVVHMDITRIDDLIRTGEFFQHPVVVEAMKDAGARGRALHLMGLVSDGGVHSQQEHLYALLRAAKQHGLERVLVHVFLDGRDTLPTSGVDYLKKLQAKVEEIGVGRIASVGGRYYAMDRDRRWERVKKAFDAMVGKTEGGAYSDPVARVKECYHNGVTDEFVEPFVVVDVQGQPQGPVRDEDVCICFNYRADRVRQITRVLACNSGLTKDDGRSLPGADDLDQVIPRSEVPKRLHYVCMTQYDKQFTLPMVILPESMENLLADMLAQANLRNLRIAETEKYAHVTYFFNGGIEKPFAGEDRLLVPSQKVATYDLAPEMSAAGISDAVIKAIGDPAFNLMVVNFANADMVGHSGKLDATVRGVETVDGCLGRIYQELKQRGGSMLITADHGNAELMIDPVTGGPHTAHTTNPVPVILVSSDADKFRLRVGASLRDISPTLLSMLGLEKPGRMTGADLRVEI